MFAFVLMPFSEEFDDVYTIGIQEAAEKVGIKAERLDSQIFASDMLDQIYTQIDKAEIIIADMTGRNPNVFYEVGYSDAKKKLVILLTSNAEDIPFDLRHRPHIVYNSSLIVLRDELEKRLKWAIEEIGKTKREPLIPTLKILSSEVERTKYADEGKLKVRIELHNLTDSAVENLNSVYIYSGKGWVINHNKKSCQKTDSDIEPFVEMHILHPDFSSIPANDWLPIDIDMNKTLHWSWKDEDPRKDEYELDGVLKISLNTNKTKYISDQKLKIIVKYDDIPF